MFLIRESEDFTFLFPDTCKGRDFWVYNCYSNDAKIGSGAKKERRRRGRGQKGSGVLATHRSFTVLNLLV